MLSCLGSRSKKSYWILSVRDSVLIYTWTIWMDKMFAPSLATCSETVPSLFYFRLSKMGVIVLVNWEDYRVWTTYSLLVWISWRSNHWNTPRVHRIFACSWRCCYPIKGADVVYGHHVDWDHHSWDSGFLHEFECAWFFFCPSLTLLLRDALPIPRLLSVMDQFMWRSLGKIRTAWLQQASSCRSKWTCS